jgi:hypothetical protein
VADYRRLVGILNAGKQVGDGWHEHFFHLTDDKSHFVFQKF